MVLVGCGSSPSATNGATERSTAAVESPATSTPSETPALPAFVTAPAAQAALLKTADLAQIVGDTDMRPLAEFTHPWELSTGVEPGSCAPRLLLNQAIAAAKYQAVSGNRIKGARGQIVAQLITVFVDKHQPGVVVADFVKMFGYCPAGQPFTTTDGRVTQHWMPTAVSSDGVDRAGMSAVRAGAGADRQEAPVRGCYHAALARSNVTVEAIVCGNGDSAGMANTVVDRIAVKLPPD
ncbi:sensor domain-containing protein (plasmid) [Mycobacterium avium subsp. hominissuis]|uniref:sensor domain-containing protein n=1 Tax=Mycobacterium avium TaxID=1764 RepID=UPI00314085B9